ncbi:MAG: hypothetical protein L0H41_16130, partial [Microlunatus sp.]|nr:hypothetical protein [Microlunatus sp.]
LAMEFARFLGLPPIRRSYNATDIADAVCQVLIEARVDLVLVDEIHNLNLATSAGEDMSDHLKYFTEHLPATFVYAGINVERSGLFTGVRGKQIAGRCVLVNSGPFPDQGEWSALVATFESGTIHLPGFGQPMTIELLHREQEWVEGAGHVDAGGSACDAPKGSIVRQVERTGQGPQLSASANVGHLWRRCGVSVRCRSLVEGLRSCGLP